MIPTEPANARVKRTLVIVGGAFACFTINVVLLLTGHYRSMGVVLVSYLVGIPLIVRKLPPVTTDPQSERNYLL